MHCRVLDTSAETWRLCVEHRFGNSWREAFTRRYLIAHERGNEWPIVGTAARCKLFMVDGTFPGAFSSKFAIKPGIDGLHATPSIRRVFHRYDALAKDKMITRHVATHRSRRRAEAVGRAIIVTSVSSCRNEANYQVRRNKNRPGRLAVCRGISRR